MGLHNEIMSGVWRKLRGSTWNPVRESIASKTSDSVRFHISKNFSSTVHIVKYSVTDSIKNRIKIE